MELKKDTSIDYNEIISTVKNNLISIYKYISLTNQFYLLLSLLK